MSKKKIVISVIVLVLLLGCFLLIRPNKKAELKTDQNGNVITSKGAVISKDDYDILSQWYEKDEIIKMDEEKLTNAWDRIDTNFYCGVEGNIYVKLKKGRCDVDGPKYCIVELEDGNHEYVLTESNICE